MSSFSRDGITYWLSDQDSDKMLGDQFGLRKIIVMAAENGKVRLQQMLMGSQGILYQLIAYGVIYL